nr:hypothetical protein [Tanacetum cinerariifolium]
MADSAWINAMQEELHQFDRLKVWELVDKPFGKNELKEPIEDQSLPTNASPTALSPGYVVDSDPEKDEKDPKDDPTYYPADRGDNDDDESLLSHLKIT